MAVTSPALAQLAAAHGVVPIRRDEGGRAQAVDADVLITVLASLGVDARDEQAVQHALREHESASWARVLPDHVVMRRGWRPWVPVRLQAGTEFTASVVTEKGHVLPALRADRPVTRHTVGDVVYTEAQVVVPDGLPLGYHELQVEAGGVTHRCPLVVAPRRMAVPASLKRAPAWGVAGHLYALRSERSWGIGETADLAELGVWAARQGADYVNVGPINAGDPVPTIDPNPYRPTSRFLLDSLAVRVEEIREIGYLSAAEHQLLEWHGDDARRLNQSVEVDHDAVWASKRAALRMLFSVERSHRRRREFDTFVEAGGARLRDYATWCVIAQEHGLPWTSWPAELHDPSSAAVAAFRDARADAVEFECWLQWIARDQFRDAHDQALASGMRIGIMHDLAAGVVDGSFEQWHRPERFAPGVRLGATTGDGRAIDLGMAALRPDVLAQNGFAFWRELVRDALAVGGALRIDRAETLFRQRWNVDGDPSRGVDVRVDHEALIGILLLEAKRAGAVLVAGDEHVADPEIRDELASRGLLSTGLAWANEGASRPLADPPRRAMGALGTKDDPPAAARLDGRALAEGEQEGTAELRTAAVQTPDHHRAAVIGHLRAAGLLAGEGSEAEVAALYRHLRRSGALLVVVRIPDLVGDTRRPGFHGVTQLHTSWRRATAGSDGRPVTLDSLMTSRRAKRMLRAMNR